MQREQVTQLGKGLITYILSPYHCIKFKKSNWDPSLFVHDSVRGKLRFELRGDDGCGGWSTSEELIADLKVSLKAMYGEMKFGGWGRQIGFDTVRDKHRGITTVTATKYITKLRQFVEGDNEWKPATPYS